MSGLAVPDPLRPLVADTPWVEVPPLDGATMRAVREAAIFDCCKWDPQVGDTSVLGATPLVLRREAWTEIGRLAEQLYDETLRAEAAIVAHPGALNLLGLPRSLVRHLRRGDLAGAPFRVMRFDFHYTDAGWRISEVNSDVPGGFIEASGFTRLMTAHHPGYEPAGDPVARLVACFRAHLSAGAAVGLVHATAYTDDRQVMVFLARALEAAGLRPLLLSPVDLRWRQRRVEASDGRGWRPLDALFRFFPAEWLPNLGWRSAWPRFIRASDTPGVNPSSALISQSKRFPLACAILGLDLPAWQRLLPETRDPRQARDQLDHWVLKPALGRVGEDIGCPGVTPPAEQARLRRLALRHPQLWAAQRRFSATPWPTAEGPRYPCIGVYVIGGRAAGAYGRISPRPLIDAHAQDVAVLVDAPQPPSPS